MLEHTGNTYGGEEMAADIDEWRLRRRLLKAHTKQTKIKENTPVGFSRAKSLALTG